eukprot:CAMPEP_0194117410 /NCGR_PEP_ID=MMETSP0150-20130528/31254_1 /TAXON_ID=122233 /ORGANISM="Chaetoceros debilis, Strain MM31A-1" /LENGTH=67 /DNA_ID=CAMNT_0038808407 /DNA_START=247 /DNA_END=450 /DNA_ORIENTATION=-
MSSSNISSRTIGRDGGGCRALGSYFISTENTSAFANMTRDTVKNVKNMKQNIPMSDELGSRDVKKAK